MIAEFEDALLPLVVWQDALPRLMSELTWPSVRTWQRWRHRLQVKTIDQDAVEYFRGGDVIQLAIDEQARIIGNQGRRRSA